MAATRRGILAGVAALPVWSAAADDTAAARGRRLAGMLTSPNSAHRVAAAWLAETGETNPRHAASTLDMDAVLAPLDGIVGITESREFLGRRIRADFAAGAVLDVDGWRLSRTEVGACLLVASVA